MISQISGSGSSRSSHAPTSYGPPGVFAVNVPMFIIASLIGRGLRFFLLAGLMWKCGDPIVKFMDKYFNLLSVAFTVLLIGGFVLFRYAF